MVAFKFPVDGWMARHCTDGLDGISGAATRNMEKPGLPTVPRHPTDMSRRAVE